MSDRAPNPAYATAASLRALENALIAATTRITALEALVARNTDDAAAALAAANGHEVRLATLEVPLLPLLTPPLPNYDTRPPFNARGTW